MRRVLCLLQGNQRIGKRFDVVGRHRPVEIAAVVFRAGILRVRFGQIVELGAALQLFDQLRRRLFFSTRIWRARIPLSPRPALMVSYSFLSTSSPTGLAPRYSPMWWRGSGSTRSPPASAFSSWRRGPCLWLWRRAGTARGWSIHRAARQRSSGESGCPIRVP